MASGRPEICPESNYRLFEPGSIAHFPCSPRICICPIYDGNHNVRISDRPFVAAVNLRIFLFVSHCVIVTGFLREVHLVKMGTEQRCDSGIVGALRFREERGCKVDPVFRKLEDVLRRDIRELCIENPRRIVWPVCRLPPRNTCLSPRRSGTSLRQGYRGAVPALR